MKKEKRVESRKQITFDLNQKALAQYYPRPATATKPTCFKKAYKDISQFMKKNGFEHRQFSVYTSIDRLTAAKVVGIMQNLAKEMPWLTPCVNQIDVTSIGSQHSLLQTLKAATALRVNPSENFQNSEAAPSAPTKPDYGAAVSAKPKDDATQCTEDMARRMIRDARAAQAMEQSDEMEI